MLALRRPALSVGVLALLLMRASAAFGECPPVQGLGDPSPSIKEWTEWCERYGRVVGSGSSMRCEFNPNWCNESGSRARSSAMGPTVLLTLSGIGLGAVVALLAASSASSGDPNQDQKEVVAMILGGALGGLVGFSVGKLGLEDVRPAIPFNDNPAARYRNPHPLWFRARVSW